ncbi:somatomedin-B and thrombospondin type-1 domain-containing protein-like isoform X1 [Delphinapterus leucas]|uniref:Somatomedin-B and thrombospondin type-1 domain-containing protein-like isoform X1 n=1 Tax=Delphinapterus leucas TaxID=9749 RepID=A0A2Y9Q2F8_DELLE|nr:somatomedin-B and thrombospondin type-1 domain-containing protein-like isoform X1 [Delphinapterus leucas]
MAPRGVAPILPLALALTAVAAVSWARGPSGTLWSRQGCAALGRCCPGRDPTCAARGPPRCFCDQACREVRDCCPDYARACPGAPPGARGMGGAPSAEGSRVPECDGTRKRGSRPRRGFWTWRGARARGTGTLRTPGEEWGWKAVSCVVAEWSGWSRCVKPCQVSYRLRQRHVLQEPRNGGAPCPPLEERAGCVEYWSHQGVECQQSLLPALITTGSYGKEREKRGVPKKQETIGYCVQFRLGPVPGSCQQVRAPHAQWTRYLTQGHTVCVRCEWPAQDARSRRCYGDGGGAGGHQLSLWQAAGHPRCRGTWERLGQLRDCSCPEVHSLVFL